jgi:hypothetical protein
LVPYTEVYTHEVPVTVVLDVEGVPLVMVLGAEVEAVTLLARVLDVLDSAVPVDDVEPVYVLTLSVEEGVGLLTDDEILWLLEVGEVVAELEVDSVADVVGSPEVVEEIAVPLVVDPVTDPVVGLPDVGYGGMDPVDTDTIEDPVDDAALDDPDWELNVLEESLVDAVPLEYVSVPEEVLEVWLTVLDPDTEDELPVVA